MSVLITRSASDGFVCCNVGFAVLLVARSFGINLSNTLMIPRVNSLPEITSKFFASANKFLNSPFEFLPSLPTRICKNLCKTL